MAAQQGPAILAAWRLIPGHLERLPGGRGSLSGGACSRATQRERILVALAEIVAKRGYQGTTVEHDRQARRRRAGHLLRQLRESRRLPAEPAFAEAAAENRRLIVAAAAGEREWPAQVRAGLAAFLDYVAADPASGPYLPGRVDDRGAGRDGALRARRCAATHRLSRGSRAASTTRTSCPRRSRTRWSAGSSGWSISGCCAARLSEVPGLLPTMLEFALAPYLGEERAARVATGGLSPHPRGDAG